MSSLVEVDVEQMDADDIVLALIEDPPPQDPYPMYRKLQEEAPRHPSIIGMRFLSKYDDCRLALRTPELHMAVAETMAKSDPRFEHSAYLQSVEKMLIFQNPPDHTRVRFVLQKAFTPRVVEKIRPRIQELVDGHLDRCEELGEFDLIKELAGLLPSQVICEMLGVPAQDQPLVEGWTEDIAGTVSPVIADEALAVADKTIQEFHAYLRELVAERRKAPREDLLSAMIQAEDEQGRLSPDELVSFAVTLLGAGTETTTNLIGVGAMALLQNPTELQQLQADPSLIGNAVEEILRFEAPVQMAFTRYATKDLVLNGMELIENEMVAILIGAANRDPDVFPDPDELRIDRNLDRAPVTFSQGAHFCMGAALARAEGQIALKTLLVDRFPNLRLLDEEHEWRSSFTLRGVPTLRVAI